MVTAAKVDSSIDVLGSNSSYSSTLRFEEVVLFFVVSLMTSAVSLSPGGLSLKCHLP